MAIDIVKSRSGSQLKNGTLLLMCKPTGFTDKDTNNDYVKNYPYIVDIENKYGLRFDNPNYYYGGGIGSVDGGDVGEGSDDTGIYDGGTYEG